ncbi:MAG: hypothetical protein JOZ69_09455, partial [Myxococcales bacterium]|nr:hypothetical protein [Myxococcales bacterium]
WLTSCATVTGIDSDWRLLATAGAWVCDRYEDLDEEVVPVVRAIAAYFLRQHAQTAASLAEDDARQAQGRARPTRVRSVRPGAAAYASAAARLATAGAREVGVAPIAKRALAALALEARAFDKPTERLAYPDEIHDIQRWLTSCATVDDEPIDSDWRLLATAGAWVCDRYEGLERDVLDVIRTIAVYFVRQLASTAANVAMAKAIDAEAEKRRPGWEARGARLARELEARRRPPMNPR